MILRVLRDLTEAINTNAQAVRELTEYLRKSNTTVAAFLIGETQKNQTKITVDKPQREHHTRYKYMATCVEDGVVTEAYNKKDLAEVIGLNAGGSFCRKFNTGKVIKSRKTGNRYILTKKEITNE